MKLYSENENYKLYQGNMLDMLEVIEPNSIDSIITDPPYGLTSITKRFGKENSAECQYGKDGSFQRLSKGFMGKEWDGSGIEYNIETWQKCYEVLKPGGYLLAFGGSRTFHRIACAIEDAGFEIRDTIMWLYGSGFPKSMDISKQIDKRPNRGISNLKLLGEKVKEKRLKLGLSKLQLGKFIFDFDSNREDVPIQSIEIGKELPAKEIYEKLKKILDLDDELDYLFEEAEREVIGTKKSGGASAWINGMNNKENEEQKYTGFSEWEITAPSTDLAKKWNGWGTALKPSFEPIIVARKPFKSSLVDNVIENGVGGINIDECRVGITDNDPNYRLNAYNHKGHGYTFGSKTQRNINDLPDKGFHNSLGRFPANTILTYDETDFDEVCGGFPNTKSAKNGIRQSDSENVNCYGKGIGIKAGMNNGEYGDSGSASRYFYCAKASKKDRDEGLEEFEATTDKAKGNGLDRVCEFCGVSQLTPELCHCEIKSWITKPRKNTHPTVKPTELMQYLVRLVSPNGATILDCFNGSGSTGKAVMYENKERNKNYKYIGIELTEEYLPIAKARIEYVCNLPEEKSPQMTIFDFIGDENE